MDGIAWAGSAMVAARTRLEIATDNLANVSTDGFHRTLARGSLTASGVTIERVPSSEHGSLRRTGRDYDFAIAGPGAFRLRDDAGRVIQSRGGAFTHEADGTLRDARGRVLLDAQDRPMHVQDASGVTAAQLGLPDGSSVHGGFLESPNTDAIREMIDVLAAERSFEGAEKVVSAIDQTRQRAATDVASVK
jgi:flagellar basal body rod protein FlgG